MKYIREHNLPVNVCLFVHDELVFEVPDSLVDEMKELLPKILLFKFPNSGLEFPVDVIVSERWTKE